jgi:hypothetical protein
MNQKSTPTISVTFIVFMAIFGIILMIVMSIFLPTAPSTLSSTQAPTQVMTSSITSSPNETHTVAAIITSKAIMEATQLATTPTLITPIYLSTGIYDDQSVKIDAALIFIDARNAWGGFIEGYRFTLFAGSQQSDPNQGVIGLVTSLPNGKKFEQFVTPSKHGAIRVVNEQYNRFNLAATDGTLFYFDLPTRQFVASMTEVAPSVTSSPSFTSSPSVTPEPTSIPYPMPTEQGTEAP